MTMTNDYGIQTDLIQAGDRIRLSSWGDKKDWGTVLEFDLFRETFWVEMDDPNYPMATYWRSPDGEYCLHVVVNEIYDVEFKERTLEEKYELLSQRLIALEEIVRKLSQPLGDR